MTWLVAIIGIAVGAVMGITGAGGGVLAVPALMAAMGWTLTQAAPVALVAVASGATIGTIDGLRRGLVRYRAALLMALAGAPFTYVGQTLAQQMQESLLRLLFGAVLLWNGVRLFAQTLHSAELEEQVETQLSRAVQIHPETRRFVWTHKSAAVLAAMGAVTGFAAGLLGVGGGFVLVPLLLRYTALTMHGAVATSLMVMALVSSSAIVSALFKGLNLPLYFTLFFALSAIMGITAGRLIAHRLPARIVQRSFAVFLLIIAVAMVLKSF